MTESIPVKTGILSGSFNPIHTGHLILAQYMAEYEGLDEIWFVVSPHNPLKNQQTLVSELHRLEMVKLAIDGNPRFRCCDIECQLPLPSYTIHTLNELEKRYPERKFTLIIGSDNWLIFNSWKDPKEIIDRFPILIYPRPGHDICNPPVLPQVKVTAAPRIEISSTFIRTAISGKKKMNFFLPEKVYKYILRENLYNSLNDEPGNIS